MSEPTSHSTDAMVKFLKERVESHQGISLEQLAGHASQLPPELRATYGCSFQSVMFLLQQFPDVFVIRNDSVYVATESHRATPQPNGSAKSSVVSASDRATNEEDITCLTDATGTVYRLFPLYGFISIESPVKASVYFDVQSFENAEHGSLLLSGLRVGDSVVFDARLGPKGCKAKFRATRVTLAAPTTLSSSHDAHDGGIGDWSFFSHLVDQHGVVEFVRSSFGFIKFGPDEKERAFFHVNNVERSLRSSIKDLLDVFSVGNGVRFNAKLSMKPSERVKWEATEVHPCRSSDRSGAYDCENFNDSEIFVSDDDSDTPDLLETKLDEYQSLEAGFNGPDVGYADLDASPAKADSTGFPVKGETNAMPLFEWKLRHKMSGQRGFFYPVTESVGTVKFGPDYGLTACAAVEVMYRDEEPIYNLLWEVADDQEVSFDAVKADDNTWIATLVWIGQRPAQPRVDDSEGVFNRITRKSWGAQKQLPNAETEPRGEFGGDGTLQNVRPSSQLFHPEGASTATFMRSPVSHNEPSTRERAPSCLPAGANDEMLNRLAKMVALEFIAEEKKLRRVLHDVSVLTVDEDRFPPPNSGPDGLVPSFVSSSTQTLSTAEIKPEGLLINDVPFN
ncbi:hypothetical protein HPB48_024015 [Haemaphysalis longicornis]|uniref:Egal-1 winged helix domain-containing protein n=1 Tax=Haemaphysalis longicornis TaxID=44386 RepID=A0A9J6H8X2_HAELO|nr:hypothetical protein HPB48_024015 [Haemaphysalis longicornis]